MRINKYKNGFTLIELMITVAIVGILTAIALPAYQDYTARAQLSEGLSLASGAKPAVAEYHANHGEYPQTLEQAGYAGGLGKYITSTTIGANGQIIATLGGSASNKITGQTISLTPTLQASGNLSWNCTSSASAKYLPSSCAHVDVANDNTGNGGSNSGSDNNGSNGGNTGTTQPTTQTYDWFSFENGILHDVYANGDFPVTATDPDGTRHFNIPPYGDVTMDVNGNITKKLTLNPTNKMQYITYTNENGGGELDNRTADDVNGKIYQWTPALSDTKYSSLFSDFKTASRTAFNTLDGFSEYNTALNNLKTQVSSMKNANGGSYPSDLPQSIIDIYENANTL